MEIMVYRLVGDLVRNWAASRLLSAVRTVCRETPQSLDRLAELAMNEPRGMSTRLPPDTIEPGFQFARMRQVIATLNWSEGRLHR